MPKKVKVRGERVLIKLEDLKDNWDKTNLKIPDEYKYHRGSIKGIVISKGVDVKDKEIKINSEIVVPRYIGVDLKIDDIMHKICNANDLLGVVI